MRQSAPSPAAARVDSLAFDLEVESERVGHVVGTLSSVVNAGTAYTAIPSAELELFCQMLVTTRDRLRALSVEIGEKKRPRFSVDGEVSS